MHSLVSPDFFFFKRPFRVFSFVYKVDWKLPLLCVSVYALQRASDGSQNHEEESEPVFGKVSELQDVVDRQTADLGQMKERMAAMVSRISELEEDLDTARKDLIKSEDMNTRLQRDLREVWRSIHL